MTSSAGERVSLPAAGVICVVGGNNVGKSQLLRELRDYAAKAEDSLAPVVLSGVTVLRPTGSEADAEAWLRERAVEHHAAPGAKAKYSFRVADHPMDVGEFHGWFSSTIQGDAYLGNDSSFFTEYAQAGELSAYAGGFIDAGGYNVRNFALLKLRTSGELESEISAVAQEAFGVPLVLDRLDVQSRLRVGEVGVEVPPLNRPTREYADALANLPMLDEQGDGFRSFVGIVGLVLTHRIDVFLIDEPEAFLHPGQARILGRWLAEVATERNMQVFAATHDRDFLLGLLSAGNAASVAVVRVSRAGNESHLTQVAPDEISDVFAKPVLRYSNVLQGLFHSQVVVCEGDADCRFYGAALDSAASVGGVRAVADDTLFVPSAGKGGISPLMAVLAKLGVRAWALPDFDVLNDRRELQAIVSAVGGVWTTEMADDYTTLARAVSAADLWETVKNAGLNAVPSGLPFEACVRLLNSLKRLRILVVSVGEMEGFYRQSAAHGSQWVSEALELRVHESAAVMAYLAPILSIDGAALDSSTPDTGR